MVAQKNVNKNKLDYYLDEDVFPYNRRTSTSRGLLFLILIEQGVKIPQFHKKNYQSKSRVMIGYPINKKVRL